MSGAANFDELPIPASGFRGLTLVRGRDDVSFALVVGLLGAETHRRADVKAALAGH